MNRSELWGFEVSHIVASLGVLSLSDIFLNIVGWPLILAWIFGLLTLAILRVISHGQKNGHLELLVRFIFEPHMFLGHKAHATASAPLTLGTSNSALTLATSNVSLTLDASNSALTWGAK